MPAPKIAVSLIKRLGKNKVGNFAITLSLSAPVLLLAAGAAHETTANITEKTKIQDLADRAALAAAVDYRHNVLKLIENADLTLAQPSGMNEQHLQSSAKKAGQSLIDHYAETSRLDQINAEFEFSDQGLDLKIDAQRSANFAALFGRDAFKLSAAAQTNLAEIKPNNIDVVLITDITFSYGPQLAAIQSNMKSFQQDLSKSLSHAGINIGNLRVKFIFFRDYSFDSIRAQPNRFAKPINSKDGPMFESKFFNIPRDQFQAEDYIDQFEPWGGGDEHESSLEAVVHALNSKGWGPGDNTVRAIVLWTDAANRPLGETYNDGLVDDFYYSNDEWKARVNNTFAKITDVSKRGRYMYNRFYPRKRIPNKLSTIQNQFERFHREHARGAEDVVTMKINLSEYCVENGAPCGDWDSIQNWDGVDLEMVKRGGSKDDHYHRVIEDVTKSAIAQISARDLAISQ